MNNVCTIREYENCEYTLSVSFGEGLVGMTVWYHFYTLLPMVMMQEKFHKLFGSLFYILYILLLYTLYIFQFGSEEIHLCKSRSSISLYQPLNPQIQKITEVHSCNTLLYIHTMKTVLPYSFSLIPSLT